MDAKTAIQPDLANEEETSMSIKTSRIGKKVLWFILCGSLLPGIVSAQLISMPDVQDVEVVHDASDLQAEVDRPDRDHVDTVMAFTNLARNAARVQCAAFNANGEIVGTLWVGIPANGMRFVLASDFSETEDFTGHARCRTNSRILSTSILLTPTAITDLSVRQIRRPGMTVFHAIAAY